MVDLLQLFREKDGGVCHWEGDCYNLIYSDNTGL